MTAHEQRMCELQSEFFSTSFALFKCSSPLFIARFMNSELAKEMDDSNNYRNYYSVPYMYHYLTDNYPSLNEKEGTKYPIPVLKWIGYIFRAYVIIKKKSSSKLYKLLKADEMLSLYDSYHTFSVEYAVERLSEIINKSGVSLTDYQIFKQIMTMK